MKLTDFDFRLKSEEKKANYSEKVRLYTWYFAQF